MFHRANINAASGSIVSEMWKERSPYYEDDNKPTSNQIHEISKKIEDRRKIIDQEYEKNNKIIRTDLSIIIPGRRDNFFDKKINDITEYTDSKSIIINTITKKNSTVFFSLTHPMIIEETPRFANIHEVTSYFIYIKNILCGVNGTGNEQKLTDDIKSQLKDMDNLVEHINYELRFDNTPYNKLTKFINCIFRLIHVFEKCKTKFFTNRCIKNYFTEHKMGRYMDNKYYNYYYKDFTDKDISNIYKILLPILKQELNIPENHQWLQKSSIKGGARHRRQMSKRKHSKLGKTLKTKKALRRQKKH
jgi:hypothetical protein